MGLLGYKGIAAVTETVYIVNDDGYHVIRILRISDDGRSCLIKDIAGKRGQKGSDDSNIGTNATFDRPSRPVVDSKHMLCYIGCRNTHNIRIIQLKEDFPVNTLKVDFQSLVPYVDLDFNRLLLTDDGDTMIVVDRQAPTVFIVRNIISLPANPAVEVISAAWSGLHNPLQGASWPILPTFRDHIWDTGGANLVDARLNLSSDMARNGFEKGLPVCYDCCFLAAGPSVWLAPIRATGDAYTTIYNVAKMKQVVSIAEGKPRAFLAHEIIPLTSNTLLLLNRDRKGTGLYQLTTYHDWSGDTTHNAPVQRLIAGSDWNAPHGMTLSLSRRHLIVVETGQGPDNDGHHGGRISQLTLSLRRDIAEVVVEAIHVVDQEEAPSEWNPLTEHVIAEATAGVEPLTSYDRFFAKGVFCKFYDCFGCWYR